MLGWLLTMIYSLLSKGEMIKVRIKIMYWKNGFIQDKIPKYAIFFRCVTVYESWV